MLQYGHPLVAVRQSQVVIYIKEKTHANHMLQIFVVKSRKKMLPFIRLMFSDILGTMKNVEIPATDEQLDKVLSNKAMFDGSL